MDTYLNATRAPRSFRRARERRARGAAARTRTRCYACVSFRALDAVRTRNYTPGNGRVDRVRGLEMCDTHGCRFGLCDIVYTRNYTPGNGRVNRV